MTGTILTEKLIEDCKREAENSLDGSQFGSGRMMFGIGRMAEIMRRRLLIESTKRGKIIVVVGNRTGWEEGFVHGILGKYIGDDDEIVSGGADGVDTFSQHHAKERGLRMTIFYPDLSKPSPQRYYDRNQEMVDYGDEMVAFQNKPGKSGTQSSINRAKAKGMPVKVIMK